MNENRTNSKYINIQNAIIIHIKQIKVIKTLHSIVLIETTELTEKYRCTFMKDEVRKYGTGMHISITQTVFVNTDLIFFCLKGHFKCKT